MNYIRIIRIDSRLRGYDNWFGSPFAKATEGHRLFELWRGAEGKMEGLAGFVGIGEAHGGDKNL
jgi:hypothetical protein